MNKMMVFVDGTNILVELSKYVSKQLRADKPPIAALNAVNQLLWSVHNNTEQNIIRRYWFASYNGDDEYLFKYKEMLRSTGFEPVLFKKRNGREKGVDIALTKGNLEKYRFLAQRISNR